MKNLLFITWDGPQTNYIESLFLPIFVRLKDQYGLSFHIIQFTWGEQEKQDYIQRLCEENSINYKVIRIFRKNAVLGLLNAIFNQSNQIVKYCKQHNIDIIMPRATTAAGIVNYIIDKTQSKYLFDADGFSQDERVDFSGWSSSGLKYRVYRYFERMAILKSQSIICRSREARRILVERSGVSETFNKITVISNGRDTQKFKLIEKDEFQIKEGLKCVYVGSLGPQYGMSQMLEIFNSLLEKKPKSIFTILTGDLEYANNYISTHYPDIKNSIIIKRVSNDEVPSYISSSDIAFAIRGQKFSMKAVSPIKLGEYLLCGIPVIATSGIGDTDYMLNESKCSYIIKDENDIDEDKISDWCLNVWGNYELKIEARKLGLKYFDINNTVQQYANAIEKLK